MELTQVLAGISLLITAASLVYLISWVIAYVTSAFRR